MITWNSRKRDLKDYQTLTLVEETGSGQNIAIQCLKEAKVRIVREKLEGSTTATTLRQA